MREALAEALSDFEGAIVMVSHDRHLIGLVCDKFWRVADGEVEPFDGDLDQYAAWLRTRATAQDMEHVDEARDPVTGLPTVSLYGSSAETLKPDPKNLEPLVAMLT